MLICVVMEIRILTSNVNNRKGKKSFMKIYT